VFARVGLDRWGKRTLRLRIPNTRVNLATGERFDRIVGEGENFEVPQQSPLTVKQLRALREFERTMREEVIPDIVRTMRMRARMAQLSRRWIVD